jgi:ubiquinone/menaquinone biosynthesis C-methylase UbiE
MVKACHVPSSNDVMEAYDFLDPLVRKCWGLDLHYGYWSGPDDNTPAQQATERLTAIVVDKLRVEPECRVLDVGCGQGRPAVAVAKVTRAQVIGIDINERALAAAAAHASAEGVADLVVFERCDALRLPYAGSSFDAVLAFESTPHCELMPLFQQIARVIKPGGRVVIETPFLRTSMTDEFRNRVGDYFDILQITSLDTFDTHLRIIRDAGFRLDEFVDITDQVNSSFVRFVKQLRQQRDDLTREHGEEAVDRTIRAFAGWANVSEEEVGGMIMVVRRLN